MDLDKKIQQLFAKQKFSKIIEILEKSSQTRRDPILLGLLATAYQARATKSSNPKRDLVKAIQILKTLDGTYYSTLPYYYFRRGAIHFSLEQWGQAYFYLAVASKIGTSADFDIEEAKKLMEESRKLISRPVFNQYFAQRVEEAWNKFENSQVELLNILNKDPKREKEVLNRINSIFGIALFNTHISLRKTDGVYELIFPKYRMIMSDFAIEYINKQAPSSFNKNWKLQLGSPETDVDTEKIYFEGEIDFEDIQHTDIWIDEELDGVYTVSGYCKTWSNEKLEESEDPQELLADCIKVYLGEVVFDKYFWINKVLQAPRKDKAIPLLEWPGYLKTKGIDIYAKPEVILNLPTFYKGPLPEASYMFPCRQDIKSGYSLYIKFLQVDEKRMDVVVDALEADGICAGFFFYRLDSFIGENREDDIQNFREKFKQVIIQNAGEKAVKIFGEAHGTNFEFVDVLIWDLPKTLEKVREFFRSSSLLFGGFQIFRTYSEIITLTGSRFWEKKSKPTSKDLKLEEEDSAKKEEH